MSECRVCSAQADGFMCRPCGREVEHAIAEMPSLFHEMSVLATGQTRVYRANGKAERDEEHRYDPEADLVAFLRSPHGRTALRPTRLMVNLDARELMWVAGNTLSSWTRHLAESRGADLPTPEGMIGWLLDHVTAIRMDEAAAEIHDEITTVHRQMTSAVDRSPSRIYAGPCHAPTEDGRCALSLYAWPNADTIRCDGFGTDDAGCGTEHTAVERADWLLGELEDALLPLDFWREWLPRVMPEVAWPNRSTWWRWCDRGQLEPKSVDRQAVEVYRGGDVIDLVIREQPRIVGNRGKTRRRAEVA